MKQLTIEVRENKYDFLLELLRSFDFIKLKPARKSEEEKEITLRNIARGMQEAKLAARGKIKPRDAKSFLNEL